MFIIRLIGKHVKYTTRIARWKSSGGFHTIHPKAPNFGANASPGMNQLDEFIANRMRDSYSGPERSFRRATSAPVGGSLVKTSLTPRWQPTGQRRERNVSRVLLDLDLEIDERSMRNTEIATFRIVQGRDQRNDDAERHS